MRSMLPIILLLVGVAAALAAPPEKVPTPSAEIYVRPGYTLTVAQASLDSPRFMEIDPQGTLYVSLPNAGQIKACRDLDQDGYYETVTTFVSNQPSVHGMFYYEGALWFTRSDAVLRAVDTDHDFVADKVTTVLDHLPKGGHWWRSILIHNNRLYSSIGDSGNITDETNSDRQKIWSWKLDGSDKQLFCSGIRNTEKLVVRPGSNEIWGMDHGSDNFGQYLEKNDRKAGQPITDLIPPDEMNLYTQDSFYGHPFIVGNRIPRYEYMTRPDIVQLAAKTTPPQWCTPAHAAPNAMEFYTADQFPDTRNDAFVAFHGSWNRSTKSGYCVDRVYFDNGHPFGQLTYVRFVTPDQKVLGRPVDVAVAPDGSVLITDDYGNRIYRLAYTAKINP